jgi:flotillin
MELFIAGAIIASLFCFVLWLVIKNLIYVAPTSEALIFAGAGGSYVIVSGGRRLRRPILEEVYRIDLTLITIEVAVTGAFSRGGIPLDVSGVANVKVSGSSPDLDRAAQRFLGLNREQIKAVAKDTLEGALRGIVAKMTPQELNEDKARFERELEHEARDTLRPLGLSLDNLKIQAVSDRAGYLSAIGEKEKAALFQRSRIAEAQNRGEAAVKSAENRRVAEIARIEAEIQKMTAEAERRILNAKTTGAALEAENRGRVEALVARARADLDVQRARIDQVKLQLLADVVQPAEAEMEASIRKARGDAARIAESGRAVADGLQSLVEQWQKAGPSAREIILLQKLDGVLATLLRSVEGIHINRFAMVGGGAKTLGDDEGRPPLALGLMRNLEELKSGTGFDLAGGLASLTGQSSKSDSGVSRASEREAEKVRAELEKTRAELLKLQQAQKMATSKATSSYAALPPQAVSAPLPPPPPALEEPANNPRLQVTRRDGAAGPLRAKQLNRG